MIYQAVTSAFVANDVGKGSAMTIVFVIIILIITLIQRRILREERESHDMTSPDAHQLAR